MHFCNKKMRLCAILISALLFSFFAPSVQNSVGFSVTSSLKNGTHVFWSKLAFDIAGDVIQFPDLLIFYNTTLYANSSLTMTVEFFDVNTSEVIYTTAQFSMQNTGLPPQEGTWATRLSPCEILKWNPLNRTIGARNVISFQSSQLGTMIYERLEISSTLETDWPKQLGAIIVPTDVATHVTFQTYASHSNSLHEVDLTLEKGDTALGLPFSGYFLSQNGTCENFITQGNVTPQTSTVVISAKLPYSGLFFLALPNTSSRDSYFTIHKLESDGVRFSAPTWVTALLLVFGVVALV